MKRKLCKGDKNINLNLREQENNIFITFSNLLQVVRLT